MKYLFFIFLLIISCSKSVNDKPSIKSPDLVSEIERISDKLYWCDGEASGNRKNNIDGRPNCDVGDAPGENGFLAMVGNFNKEPIFEALRNSFGIDGQPFRAPSYVDKHDNNEFSRDHFMGFLFATVAGLPREQGIDRVWDYYRRTGSLCRFPDDNRCKVTTTVNIFRKHVLGEHVSGVEKIIEAAEIKITAETVPLTYQAQLLANRIFVMAKLGKLTTTMAAAAKRLHEREPRHIWWHIVSLITNNGDKAEFEAVGKKLASCMQNWKQPGADWAWSEPYTNCTNVYGHELIAVAQYLLSPDYVQFIEDDTAMVNSYLFFKGVSN